MALKDEFTEEECFTLESGTPTLTVELEEDFLMIPWMSFRHAEWKEGGLRLHFQGWLLMIVGEGFAELWQEFQLQNVRTIRESTKMDGKGCVVSKLQICSA